MSVKLTNDANNGTTRLKGAEVAGDYVVTTPAFTTELAPRMQLMTAQNSTSGTSIDFTDIPSWAKKITVMFNGVSTSGTSVIIIQLGYVGGVENTGYACNASGLTTGVATSQYATGFGISDNNLITASHSGSFDITNINANSFTIKGITDFYVSGGGTKTSLCAGSKTLSGTLDRIRVTTVNGTDTFDAGQINVLYEG